MEERPSETTIAAAARGFAALPAAVKMVRPEPSRRRTPWWATTLAVAGPLADGVSTWWAIAQTGPAIRVGEGNTFFHKLFGEDVTPQEIMAFKVAQAAALGLATHFAPEDHRARAIFNAFANAAIHGFVSTRNVQNGLIARRINREFVLRLQLTPGRR